VITEEEEPDVDDFSAKVRAVAREAGADLVGIADIARFADVPKEHNPLSIFPEARSVIVVGKRVVRGALRGVEEGTQFSNYDLYVGNWLGPFLSATVFEISAFLEDNRWEAVPLMNLPTQIPPMGIAVRPGQPEPNVLVDCDEAAVRAGLGEIGYCGLLLTPQYGPRQKVEAILTDAVLAPDDMLTEPVCDSCLECAKACPLGAISVHEHSTYSISGKETVVGKVDYSKCAICQNGARPNRYHKSAPADRMAGVCTRSCVAHLSEGNRLEDTPRLPFRRREPWTLLPHDIWSLDRRRNIE
jgi:epoxyqueuosine reductase